MEFYNNWAAAEHHNGGRQQELEVFEIQDTRVGSSTSDRLASQNDKKNKIKATDPHIPQFKFKGYPDLADDFESSPRMLDEMWQKYKKQASSTQGATMLRQDHEFLDRIIQIF